MCAQVGGRRKLGHSDAVFWTSGGARSRTLHLAECLDTQRWRLTETRMERVDFQEGLLRDFRRAREFQGNTGGSGFVYVCRPTGSEHAREMSHQMQGDAVVDWLLKDGAPIQLKQHLEILRCDHRRLRQEQRAR